MLPQLSAVDSQALETLYQLFPALSEEQKKQYQALGELYRCLLYTSDAADDIALV